MGSILIDNICSSVRYWKAILIVYFIQLLLASTIGIQVYQVIEASIGNSISANHLLEGFDYTVVHDFINRHGGSISPLIGQIRWLVFVYFIFGIFLNAGLLNNVIEKKNSWNHFFIGGATYFFSFFKLALFFVPLFLFWFAILWIPLLAFGTTLLETLPNEKYYFCILSITALVFFIGIAFIIIWTLIAKISIIKNNYTVWKSITHSFKWVRARYFNTHILYFILCIFLIIVSSLFYLLSHKVGMVSLVTIVLMFFAQQAFILFRIYWRCVLYNCFSDLHSHS